jgi:chemosensory pili system protein ChpB (putative protein-glutamate methylesterase)
MAEATRVALLARPGTACERLQAALQEAGAELVLVVDPTTSDAAGVIAADVQAVLVALEPQVEDALDRFDAVLGDPAVTVIFDEAELAAGREGWDAARWVRHLAAKLGRRDDVLPPGAEPEDADAADWSVAVPATPVDIVDEPLEIDLSALDIDTAGLADAQGPLADASDDLDFDATSFDATSFDATSFDAVSFDATSLDVTSFDAPEADAGTKLPEAASQDAGEGLDLDLSAFAAEAETLAGDVPGAGLDADRDVNIGGLQLTDDLTEAVPDLGGFSFDIDLSALDAALPPAPKPAPAASAPLDTTPFEAMPAALPAEPVTSAASMSLELAPEPLEGDDSGTRDRFHRDLADLEARIAGMQLEDEPRAKPTQPQGAVLVLAGIGGPDAVRQLLGGLPDGFPRAVLIQQRLDGARHDKLVRQMQRATSLPVQLAEDGMHVEAGNVYILPAELGLAANGGLRFGGDATALLPNLPATDSAIVMLSGSDPSVVDAAMAHAQRGALVVGQAPDGCYDAIAPAELIARGAEGGAPPALAKKLAARWVA